MVVLLITASTTDLRFISRRKILGGMHSTKKKAPKKSSSTNKKKKKHGTNSEEEVQVDNLQNTSEPSTTMGPEGSNNLSSGAGSDDDVSTVTEAEKQANALEKQKVIHTDDSLTPTEAADNSS